MLGGADMNKLFSVKILEAGKNKPLYLNTLDGAYMKKFFSMKMLDGAGIEKLL